MVSARLRKVRLPLGAVALLAPFVALITLLATKPALAPIPVLLAVAGVTHFWVRRLRPHRWPVAGVIFNVLSGALVGAALPLPWVGVPVAAIVFGALGWWWADDAKRTVLEPYTAAFAESRVEVVWRARGTKRVELLVGPDRVTLAGPFRRVRPALALSAVGVEQVMVAKRTTVPVPGVGEVRVTPGPAVRITAGGGEWVLPTDQGREIARLVAGRKRWSA